jgi:hypothetical protein
MEDSKGERDERLVELAKVQGDFEAQVLKGMLESEGIEVAIRTGVAPSILPFTVDGLGQVKLFVKESDLEAARAVMRENEEREKDGEIGDPGDPDDAGSCN